MSLTSWVAGLRSSGLSRICYDVRGDKLGIATTNLNERIAEAIERAEIDDVNVEQRLEAELKDHFSERQDQG